MLKVDKKNTQLVPIENRTMELQGIKERPDLHDMILNSEQAFFSEINDELMVIGSEIKPSDEVLDSIDILCLDRDGSTVIIELKRGKDRLQLLQSLSYSAMVGEWHFEQLVEERCRYTGADPEETKSEILDFIDVGGEAINEVQRIILIAEAFEYEVLVTAKWLHEQYDVDVRCFRMNLSCQDEENVFINFSRIYPPEELTEHAKLAGRKRGPSIKSEYKNWEDLVESLRSDDTKTFFREVLKTHKETNLGSKEIYYRHHGKRKWNVGARKDRAYVWQEGRFANDLEFWKSRLSKPESVEPKAEGTKVRFTLLEKADFENFKRAISEDLADTEFLESTVREAPEEL